MPTGPSGMSAERWAKIRAEAAIANFQTMVEDADIEEVDEPTGRKEITIAYTEGRDIIEESGEVYGLYRDGETLVADWTDDRSQTVVPRDNVVDLDESEYYTV